MLFCITVQQTVHYSFKKYYFGIPKTAMFHSDLLEWSEALWCETLKKWNCSCGTPNVQQVP